MKIHSIEEFNRKEEEKRKAEEAKKGEPESKKPVVNFLNSNR